MEVTINYLAVILAAASTMIVGATWYAEKAFGAAWMKLVKIKPNKNMTSSQMTRLYGGAFLTSLITALVLAYFAGIAQKAFGGSLFNNTILIGLLGWFGFTATRIHMHDTFENRPAALTLLNVMHEFTTVMIMAIIIGLMGV